MNADLKRRWVDKLRSGEIEQGHGMLCNFKGQMCCLGVLAEVDGQLKRDMVFAGGTGSGFVAFDEHHNANRSSYVLSPDLEEKYGLRVLLPWVDPDDERDTERPAWACLTGLNDRLRWSFGEIADWAEANIPED